MNWFTNIKSYEHQFIRTIHMHINSYYALVHSSKMLVRQMVCSHELVHYACSFNERNKS